MVGGKRGGKARWGKKGELHLDLISFLLMRHGYGSISKHGHEYTFLNRENELNLNMQIILQVFLIISIIKLQIFVIMCLPFFKWV